jgi:hypothetical protein
MDDHTATPLTEADIESFKENGFIRIKGAFSPHIASECSSILWQTLMQEGISPYDPMTWVRRKSIGHIYNETCGYPWSEVVSSRLTGAINSICGENQWEKPLGLGWWTITFPGYFCDSPWDIDGQWHVDGQHVHYPFSKDIGLTAIMLFSDVYQHLHGATTVLKGSHKYISNIIAESGFRGLSGYQIKKILNECEEDWVAEELAGGAGDVYLIHPHLVHARSRNVGQYGDISGVRIVCHPSIPLHKEMNFCRKDLSPLESSIFNSVSVTDDYNPLYFVTPENVAEFEESRKQHAAFEADSDELGKNKRRHATGADDEHEGPGAPPVHTPVYAHGDYYYPE